MFNAFWNLLCFLRGRYTKKEAARLEQGSTIKVLQAQLVSNFFNCLFPFPLLVRINLAKRSAPPIQQTSIIPPTSQIPFVERLNRFYCWWMSNTCCFVQIACPHNCPPSSSNDMTCPLPSQILCRFWLLNYKVFLQDLQVWQVSGCGTGFWFVKKRSVT